MFLLIKPDITGFLFRAIEQTVAQVMKTIIEIGHIQQANDNNGSRLVSKNSLYMNRVVRMACSVIVFFLKINFAYFGFCCPAL